MHEGDPASSGSSPGNLVHQLISRLAAPFQRGVEIGHPVTDVMNAGTTFFQEAGDRALRMIRRQQLDLGFAERKRNDGGAVRGFRRMGNQPEDVTVEGKGGLEIGDRHANVGNTGCLGHIISGHATRPTPLSAASAKVIGARPRGQGVARERITT